MNLNDTATWIAVLASYAPKGHPPHWIARDALKALRDARSHGRIQEIRCNREVLPSEEKRETMLEKRISATLAPYGVEKIDFTGDPRGFTVKVHLPKRDGRKPANTWGGEETGYGIG